MYFILSFKEPHYEAFSENPCDMLKKIISFKLLAKNPSIVPF